MQKLFTSLLELICMYVAACLVNLFVYTMFTSNFSLNKWFNYAGNALPLGCILVAIAFFIAFKLERKKNG